MTNEAAHEKSRLLVVSIHDVTSPFEETLRRQMEALRAAGVDRLVLKVVPNWQGEYLLDSHETLVGLLRDMLDSGSEIVLHGWQHRPVGPLHGSWMQRRRGTWFSANACEFLTLTREQATQAVSLGQEMLARCGFAPADTFCPPGWLINEEALQGVRDAGIRYLVRMMSVEDLATGRAMTVPSFGHMGTEGISELGISVMGAGIRRLLRGRRVARVYLHAQARPGDPFENRTLRQIAKLVNDGWKPAVYANVANEMRMA